MSSQRSSKGKSVAATPSSGVDHLAQDVSGMTLGSSQNDQWETVGKKKTTKQWVTPNPAPRAWGQPDTANRLGIMGSNGSGRGSVTGGNSHNCRPGGQVGNPHPRPNPQNVPPTRGQQGLNWAHRVGGRSPLKANVPVADEDEDDVDVDDDDEYLDDDDIDFSDGFESDDTVKSFETRKKHKMLSKFFEDMDKLTMEEVNEPSRQWHCPACQNGPGAIDWFKGLQPLALHAKTKGSARIKLHREFAELLDEELSRKGTSYIPSGEYFGQWEGLVKETKDHEIVWPPMVAIMNTQLDKDDKDNKWLGMGNQELLDLFPSYAALKARHSYGPQGHRGMSVLIFESSAVGYMEADRLHRHFISQGTGRDGWAKKKVKFSGGRRQLHGFLATKDDLDFFNQHSQGKTRLKFDIRSYQEMVVSQLKQMGEDNQQLRRLKNKVAEEQRQSKLLNESVTMLSQKLRREKQKSRIVLQRTQMQHAENKAEMDYQAQFFNEQMKKIEEAMDAKEERFEKMQQSRRKEIEQETGADDSKKRTDVVADRIKLQVKEMEEFTARRTEIAKTYEEKKAEMKKRHWEEELKLEKEFDSEMSELMESYAPGSTSFNDSANES